MVVGGAILWLKPGPQDKAEKVALVENKGDWAKQMLAKLRIAS